MKVTLKPHTPEAQAAMNRLAELRERRCDPATPTLSPLTHNLLCTALFVIAIATAILIARS